jgi:hypothetical protein
MEVDSDVHVEWRPQRESMDRAGKQDSVAGRMQVHFGSLPEAVPEASGKAARAGY